MNLSGASNYYFLKQFLGDHYELGYIDAWKIMSQVDKHFKLNI